MRTRHRLVSTFLASLAFLLALVTVGAHDARATTVTLTLDEIVSQSDVVVRVTVVASSTRWVGRRIVTFHELRVDDVLRANGNAKSPSIMTLALPGGVVDGIGQRVAGTPELRAGSSYVLCLSKEMSLGKASDRGRALVGLWRGAWTVLPDLTLAPFAHDVAPGTAPRAPGAASPA